MPLLDLEQINKDSLWALWQIEEDISSLLDLYKATDIELETLRSFKSIKRKKEWLAGRLAAKITAEKYGITFNGVEYNDFGKPYLKDSTVELSITHSYPYAAAILHRNKPIGIDIELIQDKFVNLSRRFLSEDELLNSNLAPQKICIYWCAKEVLYKIYHQKKLTFTTDLRIGPFEQQLEGYLDAYIDTKEDSKHITIKYLLKENYIIAFNV